MAGKKHPYKSALQWNFQNIETTIETCQLLPRLVQNQVISTERKRALENIVTVTEQARALLENLLQENETARKNFVQTLVASSDMKHRQIGLFLEKEQDDFSTGKKNTQELHEMRAIRNYLQNTYAQEEWTSLWPIPGSTLRRQVSSQHIIMAPNFTTQRVDYDYLQGLRNNVENEAIRQTQLRYTDVNNNQTILEILRSGVRGGNLGSQQFQIHLSEGTLPSHVTQLTGDAGTGKTTLVHNIVWKWANEDTVEHSMFQAMFLLPVKRVKNKRIIDALCTLKLIDKRNRHCLDGFLSNPSLANQVLFILDGLDETQLSLDSEVAALVKGKLYPGCNVLLTCRPEAKILTELRGYCPDYKVTLRGITDQAVEEYIRNIFIGRKNNDQVDQIIQRYRERLVDISLLRVPLYLTMICFIFDDELMQYMPDAKFVIPQTMTGVFNTFLRVIVCIYLHKLDRHDHVSFARCPLDADSTLPADVCQIIYFVGRMAFHGIIQDQTDFTADDLKKNFLSEEIVSKLGVFSIDIMDKKERDKSPDVEKIVFFRHRTLQEYFAANYLVAEGLNTQQFLDLFDGLDEPRLKNEDKNLWNIFPILGKTIQFACGLSPAFFETILQLSKGRVFIPFRAVNGRLVPLSDAVVAYEISLFHELNDANRHTELANSLFDYLKCARILSGYDRTDVENKIHRVLESLPNSTTALEKTVSHSDRARSLELLKQWYHLELVQSSRDENDCVVSRVVHNNVEVQEELQFKSCDLLLFLLLTKFNMPTIRRLQVSNVSSSPGIRLPLPALLVTMPNTEELKIQDMELTASNIATKRVVPNSYANLKKIELRDIKWERGFNPFQFLSSHSALTHLTMSSVSKISLCEEDIASLCKLVMLERLQLTALNITENMSHIVPQWCRLQEVHLSDCMIPANQVPKLCDILREAKNVTSVDVSHNDIGGQGVLTLVTQLSTVHVHLRHLSLKECNINSPYARDIFSALRTMGELFTLKICTTSLAAKESQEAFVDMMERSRSIDTVEIHEAPHQQNVDGNAFGIVSGITSVVNFAMSYIGDLNERKLASILSAETLTRLKCTEKKVIYIAA